eukprot:COSAG01_NODE_3821_length_5636_cov_28.570838_4_plen_322_part_00
MARATRYAHCLCAVLASAVRCAVRSLPPAALLPPAACLLLLLAGRRSAVAAVLSWGGRETISSAVLSSPADLHVCIPVTTSRHEVRAGSIKAAESDHAAATLWPPPRQARCTAWCTGKTMLPAVTARVGNEVEKRGETNVPRSEPERDTSGDRTGTNTRRVPQHPQPPLHRHDGPDLPADSLPRESRGEQQPLSAGLAPLAAAPASTDQPTALLSIGAAATPPPLPSSCEPQQQPQQQEESGQPQPQPDTSVNSQPATPQPAAAPASRAEVVEVVRCTGLPPSSAWPVGPWDDPKPGKSKLVSPLPPPKRYLCVPLGQCTT